MTKSVSQYIELELLEKLNETLSELNEMQKVNNQSSRPAETSYSTMAKSIVSQIEELSIEIREAIKVRES